MLAGVPGSFVSLSASWMTPEQPYGILTGYTVRCRWLIPGFTLMTGFDRDYNSSVQNVILSDLNAATEHNCSVRAFNGAGSGPFSESYILNTPQHSEYNTLD